ncbi:MAG: prepilin-type N-terminal cleavage/methylation domain-containing protein [Phycisphaera sp.]|nr:prepilin-type N-terminal cleavage/methylation domain-containing protein [Phycisphaera sp.]
MAAHSQTHRGRSNGFTLIELVAASAILAIVMAAMASTMLLASKALPSGDDVSVRTLRASRWVDTFATELETAQRIISHDAGSITFVVPDRNGDGYGQRVAYTWSSSKKTLSRGLNNAAPSVILSDVDAFSLTCQYASATELYPGVGVEQATDSLLMTMGDTSGTAGSTINSTNWVAQYVSPTISASAMTWRPTKVRFQAKALLIASPIAVQLRTATTTLSPSNTVLDEQTLLGSVLSLLSYGWQQATFNTVPALTPDTPLTIVWQPSGLVNSASILTDTNTGSGLVTTSNSGSSWSYQSNQSVVCEVYGRITTPGASQLIERRYLKSVTLEMRTGGSDLTRTRTTVHTYNTPELLTDGWSTDFTSDPTKADLDADGNKDWILMNRGAKTNWSNSATPWTAGDDQWLTTNGNKDFTHLTIIDVTMRDTVYDAGDSGATAEIYYDRSGNSVARILAQVRMEKDGTQTLTLNHNTTATTVTPLAIYPMLTGDPVQLRLVLDPTHDSVALFKDGVHKGTFAYARPNSPGDNGRYARFGSVGLGAAFSSISILHTEVTP